MKDLCIVIPVYNKTPELSEVASLKRLANVCPGKYDICFIYPESWKDTGTYDDIVYNIDTKRDTILHISFEDKYFESTVAYSDLMKWRDLYNRFKDYTYILIWQTDCWAIDFSSIDKWLECGFDYIGAPIIANKQHWSAPCCGNGGLSLRKVQKFIELTSKDDLREIVEKQGQKYVLYEDVYFCEGLSQFIYIDMPSWEECAEFAWDMNPDVLETTHKFTWKGLVGCHAFGKNIPYWADKLCIPKDVIKESYNKHMEFIDIYYRGIGDMENWMVDCSNTKYV